MLTPAFDLHQNSNFLTITIKAPFAKVSETEVFVEENDFKFYSKPYFLRLTLPGNIVEDSREKGDYDAETGVFTLRFPKQSPGEQFEGLDMITQLLAPRGSTTAAPPSIEVIDDCPSESDSCHGDLKAEEEEEEFDWSIEQSPYEEETHPLDAPKYGFANQKSGVFSRLQEELAGIVDVPEPDTLSQADRRRLRLEAEMAKFDEDHYISDMYEDDLIQPLVHYEAPWLAELERVKSGSTLEAAGNTGAKGEPGLAGVPGLSGASGPQGEGGLPGRDGLPGLDGPAGPRGPDGDDGLAGLQGTKGDTGVLGFPGEPGRDGLPGLPGQRGQKGEEGLPGLNREAGHQGLNVELTEDEKDTMRRLPRREYLLDEQEERWAYLGLVDIVYAFAYNHRITEGENTVESGWTVSKICATLSWLEVFSSVKDVAVASFRRSLCYPLFRHWGLNMAVWNDVKHIFQLGRRRLLKCLLEVRGILTDQDSRYVLNDLYISDYCVWLQSTSEKKITSLCDAVLQVTLTKDEVHLDLPEVERLASVSLEEDGIETVTDTLAQMSVVQPTSGTRGTDSDDVSTETDDESTDTDSSSTDSDDDSTNTDNVNTHTDEVRTHTDDESTNIDDVNTKTVTASTDKVNSNIDDLIADERITKSNDTNCVLQSKNCRSEKHKH